MSPAPVTSATFPQTFVTTPHNLTFRIHLHLTWKPADPAAVAIRTVVAGHSHAWLVARDVLTDGLDGPVGDGDITVAPSLGDGMTEIVLRDHTGLGGNRAMHLPTDGIRNFLQRTFARCRRGDEQYEWTHADLFSREGAA